MKTPTSSGRKQYQEREPLSSPSDRAGSGTARFISPFTKGKNMQVRKKKGDMCRDMCISAVSYIIKRLVELPAYLLLR